MNLVFKYEMNMQQIVTFSSSPAVTIFSNQYFPTTPKSIVTKFDKTTINILKSGQGKMILYFFEMSKLCTGLMTESI